LSTYSGKADFYDVLTIHSDSENWDEMYEKFKGTKLYKHKPLSEQKPYDLSSVESILKSMKEDRIEIKYNSILDLAPYFPYIVAISCTERDNPNQSIIVLSSAPYPDQEEQDILNYYKRDLLAEWRKCKRKKLVFRPEFAAKNHLFGLYNYEPVLELAKRIEKYGLNVKTDGIKLDMQEYYRNRLKEDIERYKKEKNENN